MKLFIFWGIVCFYYECNLILKWNFIIVEKKNFMYKGFILLLIRLLYLFGLYIFFLKWKSKVM